MTHPTAQQIREARNKVDCIAFNFDCIQGGVGVTADDIRFLLRGYRSLLDAALEQNSAQKVCYETYQLIGQFVGENRIPRIDHWLDNLAEARLVHTDLLPVRLIEK